MKTMTKYIKSKIDSWNCRKEDENNLDGKLMAAELKKKITKIDKLVFIYKMELPGDNQVL